MSDQSAIAYLVAEAAQQLVWTGLSERARYRTRWSVLDFMGCVMGGAELRESSVAVGLASPGAVRVPGFEQGFDLPGAALVMGVAGTLLQLHDLCVVGGVRGKAGVIAAAWGFWQRSGGSVERLLEAVLAGLEARDRLQRMDLAKARGGKASVPAIEAVAAAVAAGRVAGLNFDQLVAAIGHALLLSSDLNSQTPLDPQTALQLHDGLIAQAGVEAVLLAEGREMETAKMEVGLCISERHEATGTDPALLHPEAWRGSALDDSLFRLMPACFQGLAAVEAALQLPRVPADQIAGVEIILPVADEGPSGAGTPSASEPMLYDKLLSANWPVAYALVHGQYNIETARNGAIRDRVVDALMERVTVTWDAALDIAGPRVATSTVRISCIDGTKHEVSHRRRIDIDMGMGVTRGWIASVQPELLLLKFALLAQSRMSDGARLLELLMPSALQT